MSAPHERASAVDAALGRDHSALDELARQAGVLGPDVGRSLRVIEHFDRLLESRASLQAIVREAALLARCPVRLVDPGRRLYLRMLPDGAPLTGTEAPDPSWPSRPATTDGAVVWLERPGSVDLLGAMVLERATFAVRAVLDRTRSRTAHDDPALVELLLDATAAPADREAAGRRLDLPATAMVVAFDDGSVSVLPADTGVPVGRRAGVGPVVPISDLPDSWQQARLALRVTSDGGPHDPGPTVIHAAELGSVLVLVEAVGPGWRAVPDVEAIERAAAEIPWLLVTLDAVSRSSTLRDAARRLQIHHSTLQKRLTAAEGQLGWDVHDRQGQARLTVALVLRRALRSATPASPTRTFSVI